MRRDRPSPERRPGRPTRLSRPDRPARPGRPERSERFERPYRPDPGRQGRGPAPEDVRWGTHAVEEALRAGRVQRLLLQDDAASRQRLRVLADAAHREGTPITYAPPGVLTARAGTDRHQGAVAETKPFVYTALPDLLAGGRGGAPDEPLLLLALDGVEDPQNLGAILRSADGAGVHGVLLPEHRAAGITAAVARASAGAVDHVPVARVVNLPRALDQLKAAGVWVYGLDAAGAERYDRADYDRPVVVVAGAEGKGLSRLVSERCDLLLRIPLHGRVASLNVSVAASLALFAARSSRQG